MDLEKLIPLLRCPETASGLLRKNDSQLSNYSDTRQYLLVDGVPVFTEEGASVTRHPATHLSNSIADAGKEIISSTEGLVLNLSAGGSEVKPANVVELEYSIFRHTDVVGDAHYLPFQDETFSACICMNAFEHYRNPRRVADELLRVLKPGGTLFLHTAGLQPLHEPPHHYYNVTKFGLIEWLKNFEIEHICVSENFNPGFALSWLISEIERGILANQGTMASVAFKKASLGDVMNFWRDPKSRNTDLWQTFQRLDSGTQETCAAGWEAKVTKPLLIIPRNQNSYSAMSDSTTIPARDGRRFT
jgi:SAM-dependent methyltransferase